MIDQVSQAEPQRRYFLRLIAGAAAAAAAPAGATNMETTAVLNRGNGAEPTSLDPALATIVAEVTILRDMFIGLTALDASGATTFGVASAHKVSSDGLRHTYSLRPDAIWSDGNPLTAEDFVYSFRRLFTPATGASYPQHLFALRNAQKVASGLLPATAVGVNSEGPATLHLDLERPTPSLNRLLQMQMALPVPRHAIERHGTAWTRPDNIVVNGPYTLEDWQPQSFVRLRVNRRYWQGSPPDFTAVMYYPTANSALEARRFRAGELDIAVNIPPEDVPWLMSHLPLAYRSSPGLNVYYLVFNIRKPPFNSPLVREALSLAIDRQTMVSKVLGTGETPAYSLVPAGTPDFQIARPVSELEIEWPVRQQRARQLLAQAGYGGDHPLEFEVRFSSTGSYGRKGCIAAAAMWHMIGVRAKLLTTEGRVHFAQLREGAFEAAWADWGSTVEDAASFLQLLRSDAGAANYGGFSDPEFDELFSRAQETDSARRSAELMAMAEAQAMRTNPVIPVFSSPSRSLVSPRVAGWVDNIVNVHPSSLLHR